MIAPILHQVQLERVVRRKRSTQKNAESAGLVHILSQCGLEAQRIRETILYQLANGPKIGLEAMVIQELLDAGTNHYLLGKVDLHICPFLGYPFNSSCPKQDRPLFHDSGFTSLETPQGAPSRARRPGADHGVIADDRHDAVAQASGDTP
jgi:hypothetical protein